ncbi:MAG: 50S ribosomal protein L2 [Candidatus Nomurabacteria bacterium]|nr:50S ribosomal protein L2 [Candidatus Nomurabacteria bacterium]
MIKKYKPTSNGRRGMTGIDYRKVLTATEPNKKLTKGRKQHAGRASSGRISVRHKGGGNKRMYRQIDFLFDKRDIPARVETVEYDPNRNGFIGVLVYADGERRYTLLPQKVVVGDTLIVSEKTEVKPGNRMALVNIPVGTFVYAVELQPRGGAKLARSAGTYVQVTAHDEGKTLLKMPSGEIRKVPDTAFASVGEVSNPEYKLVKIGKAGRARHMGRRPTVRGSAMNPVDHPHGGGEGKQGIGLRRGPKTRQGKLAYGVKTRKSKKYSNKNIVKRRKTKRFQ